MVNCSGFGQVITAALFEYDTPKIVHIKSKKVGLINRLIQLLIIGYIIGFVIIFKKGYQETEVPYSSVTTKVKGVALTNLSGINVSTLPLYGNTFLWDSADYVVPPEENNAFFVTTNMIITPNQTQGTCPEDPKFQGVNCTKSNICVKGKAVYTGHGTMTGRCVDSDRREHEKVCQIYSWCPVEVDILPMKGFGLSKSIPLLDAAKNFTVLIKNSVNFPKFGESRRNIKPDADKSYLRSCQYHPRTDPLCPIFSLGDVVTYAGENFEKLAFKGGVIGIIIKWNCNFDALSYKCEPHYTFKRLDDSKTPIAGGYNFRYPVYYVQDNKLFRTLIKAYGIRFVVMTEGKGGKFGVVPLFLNIGSGLALLGIASVLCDIFVLYVLQKRYYYRGRKYDVVTDDTIEDQGSFNDTERSRFAKQKNYNTIDSEDD